jgi:hypothetical protein
MLVAYKRTDEPRRVFAAWCRLTASCVSFSCTSASHPAAAPPFTLWPPASHLADDQLAAEEAAAMAAAMGNAPGYCADRVLRAAAGGANCPKFFDFK